MSAEMGRASRGTPDNLAFCGVAATRDSRRVSVEERVDLATKRIAWQIGPERRRQGHVPVKGRYGDGPGQSEEQRGVGVVLDDLTDQGLKNFWRYGRWLVTIAAGHD
jgi:hypothetical protein